MKSQSHSKSKLFAYKKDRKPKSQQKQAKTSFFSLLSDEKMRWGVPVTQAR